MSGGWTKRSARGQSKACRLCFFSPSCSSVTDRWLFPEAASARDLAERAMICSPGVLHARPSNSASRLGALLLSLFLLASRFARSHPQNRSHRFLRFDQSHAVGFFRLRCASYPLRLSAGYNLVEYPSIHSCLPGRFCCVIYIRNRTGSLGYKFIDKLKVDFSQLEF